MQLGLYEEVISETLDIELQSLPTDFEPERTKIDKAEASEILAAYLARQAKTILDQAADEGIEEQVHLINKMLDAVRDQDEPSPLVKLIDNNAVLLQSLRSTNHDSVVRKDNKTVRPKTSLSQSSLFTGSRLEPQLYSELKKEIVSADRIDMLVSFIKWSGLSLLIVSVGLNQPPGVRPYQPI